MTTVAAVRTDSSDGTHRHLWEGLNTSDLDGQAISIPGAADRSVQIIGVFDTCTIVLQGSNEATPTNWHTLADPQGSAISTASAILVAILENVSWIRPLMSSAGASSDIDVILLSRK